METNLSKELEKGYIRLSLICSVWAIIGAIPLFIFIHQIAQLPYYELIIIAWLIWVIIGVALSNKIYRLIWKKKN